MKYFFYIILFHAVMFFNQVSCMALDPDEVLVVANRNASGSMDLAKYYMDKRQIPGENLIKLWVPEKEAISRSDYEHKIAGPVKQFLDSMDEPWRIRCLVLIYGVPLKIAPPAFSKEETEEKKKLEGKKERLSEQLKAFESTVNNAYKQLKKELEGIQNRISVIHKSRKEKGASVDSEIALVMAGDYDLSGWMPNPYYIGHKDRKTKIGVDQVLMVSRLDGPSEGIVRRIIDDSLFAEEKGLSGGAYFDARWKKPTQKKTSGYAFYDQSIHNIADRLQKADLMPVTIDDKKALFQAGECPATALYCGWYSLANYVDAFDWMPGAVGYHIASAECATLKKKNSRVWCKMMLEDGIAATIGPVGEPYVQAFPVPELFFGFLVDGYLTLAECYLISTPFLSWQMVLIGDPLYRPFKNRTDRLKTSSDMHSSVSKKMN